VAEDPAAEDSGSPAREGTGELISAGSALVLLALMFGVKWFGIDRLPGHASGVARETSVNAWQAMSIVRWLMLLTIFVAIGSALLHASQRSHGTTTDTGAAVTILGALTALLLIYRVLIDLPSSSQIVDQKVGAVLGILSALGIALGGHTSMRHERFGSRAGQRSRPERTGVAGDLQAR
jgi:hypothetical protein